MKKILSLITAVFILVYFTGCGGESNTEPEVGSTSSSSQSAATLVGTWTRTTTYDMGTTDAGTNSYVRTYTATGWSEVKTTEESNQIWVDTNTGTWSFNDPYLTTVETNDSGPEQTNIEPIYLTATEYYDWLFLPAAGSSPWDGDCFSTNYYWYMTDGTNVQRYSTMVSTMTATNAEIVGGTNLIASNGTIYDNGWDGPPLGAVFTWIDKTADYASFDMGGETNWFFILGGGAAYTVSETSSLSGADSRWVKQ